MVSHPQSLSAPTSPMPSPNRQSSVFVPNREMVCITGAYRLITLRPIRSADISPREPFFQCEPLNGVSFFEHSLSFERMVSFQRVFGMVASSKCPTYTTCQSCKLDSDCGWCGDCRRCMAWSALYPNSEICLMGWVFGQYGNCGSNIGTFKRINLPKKLHVPKPL